MPEYRLAWLQIMCRLSAFLVDPKDIDPDSQGLYPGQASMNSTRKLMSMIPVSLLSFL